MVKKFVWLLSLLFLQWPVFAEVDHITLDIQNGSNYMGMVIMEKMFWEETAKANGIATTIELNRVGGPGAAAERFLSGANQGMTISYPLILSLNEKTAGDCKILFGNSILDQLLNVNNPKIQKVTDFKEGNKVAVTTLNTSIQAINMRALADKYYQDFKKFDPITVQLSHPDAFAALMAGKIDAHWATPPFSLRELENPAVHTVARSSEIFGEAHLTAFAVSVRFCTANPKVCDTLFQAYKKANDWINADFDRAADYFAKNVGTKDTKEDYLKQFKDKVIVFDIAPKGIMAYARYSQKFGLTKKELKSWKDLVMPQTAALNGN